MWQSRPSVFEVRDFESTVRFLIGGHPGPWESIKDFIDVLLQVFTFFQELPEH